MNRLIILSTWLVLSLFFFQSKLYSSNIVQRVDVASQQTDYPFSTDSSHFTHWNGARYVPFTIKGMNLGVSVPGTFPGELAATTDQYWRWFTDIKEIGYNVIRLYTLHYPRFYNTLDSFNVAHPDNPIYIIQGVWLEEELAGYNQDLFYTSSAFSNEVEENVDCLHGNRTIDFRFGKAYGTYTKDVSKWVMAYLIGREVSNWEIETTNDNQPSLTSYTGEYLSISGVHAAEVFVTQHMDSLLIYEQNNYGTQRPVAFSSWPTLDPLTHPTETHTTEDDEVLELAGMDFSKAKAGFFVSYHAYPYYPDFISRDALHQAYADEYGANMYLGYLFNLKNHYKNIPLLIAEFGLPSSWGVAHYSQSGMHHGGNTELNQGIMDMRMFKNFEDASCAGGIQFAWIDEWFKRTWVTDPFDFGVDDRVMWQNVMAAEQNFGLVGFKKATLDWETLAAYSGSEPIDSIESTMDHAFFYLKLHTNQSFANLDTLWLAIDTYDSILGERVLASGDTVQNGAEFLLRITNDEADLFVTQAYDLYGIWHGISPAEQLYHSTTTLGAPWNIVRWKNNSGDQDIQYVGHLTVNRLNLPATSMDAVTMAGDSISIRLPWSLLQFTNPAYRTVFADDRSTTSVKETVTSDGIAVAVKYKGTLMQPTTRYTWSAWNNFNDLVEYKKAGYYYMEENLPYLLGFFIPIMDNYKLENGTSAYLNDASNGLMSNDILLENGSKETVLIDPPMNGFIDLNSNGTFEYLADNGYVGTDKFTYKVIGDYHVSDTATVNLDIIEGSADSSSSEFTGIRLYPNPAVDYLHVISSDEISSVKIVNANGETVMIQNVGANEVKINTSAYETGVYVLFVDVDGKQLMRKIIVKRVD